MNQYRIIDRLASGSFGVVFKAVRLSDNRVLVLKRVNLANMDERSRNTAREEVELMQQLHHPHIVQHRDAFMFNDEDLCIVMDYYGGGDLSQMVQTSAEELQQYFASHPQPTSAAQPFKSHASPARKHAPKQSPASSPSPSNVDLSDAHSARAPYLPESRIMLWFVEISLSLHYLHSHRIIHRDLKTQNIFVNTANGEVAVGDFGVARIAEAIAQAHEASPTSTGTPLYMAPEVVQGGHATFKSDIWSLGCILYELIALRHPFASSDLSGLMIRIAKGHYQKLPPHFSKPLHRLVDRMLEKDPKKRPLIDEILSLPFVKSYLRTYLSIRVPLENHDSAGEQMLGTQLRALGVEGGTDTEFTEEVLGGGHHHNPQHGTRPKLPVTLSVDHSSQTPMYARLDAHSLRDDGSVSLEDIGSPTSKYEAMHRSHVAEAFSPEPQRLSRKPSHQRMMSQPALLSFGPNDGGEENQGMQMFRANTQQEHSIQQHHYAGNPGRRSTSLEPPSHHLSHQGNVEDMKGKTISEIEKEVRKLRELVRHEEMSGRTQGHDDTHQSTLASEAIGRAARSKRRDNSPNNDMSLPSRTAVTSFTTQGGGDERAPLSRRGQTTSQFYRSNPEVAGSSSLGHYPAGLGAARVSELSKIQRRRQLHQQCVQTLGEKAFHDVYRYYHSVLPKLRDAEVVRHFVPDRACWHVLPIVEAIVQIDRDAMTSV